MVTTALSMEGITKRFPGTLAVDGVDFSVEVGEIHALVGENGAGKSTLMNVLAGLFADYSGRILIGGREVTLHSPTEAKAHGIEMTHQELSLAAPLSIAENLLAGRLPTRYGLVHRRALHREAKALLALVGLDVDPGTAVSEISQHEAQLVEIAKALGNKPCILVMDEPTSALSREEVQRLFAILRDLKRGGLAIVYISHHLSEIFQIADRVTVLRDGKRVGAHDIGEVTPQAIVRMMVGQAVDEFYARRMAKLGDVALDVAHATRYGFFHDVSFQVRRGEIVGLVGLSGAGRTELARSVCGLDPMHHGRVSVMGNVLATGGYPEAVAKGLVYLSEDRKVDGLFLRLSVRFNLLAALTPFHSVAGIYRAGNDGSITERYLKDLDIVAASADADVGTLSGGNQQKVLLAKWLATCPRVLILDEPTRGVDIGAKRTIHEAVMALADEGTAVLLISSDLPELVGLSERALVMRNGRLIREMAKEELSEETALLAANGEGMVSNA